MHASLSFDVAGPGILVAAAVFGFGALVALTLFISFAESIVMFLLKWDKYGRSLLASLLMNVTSTIFGGILVAIGALYSSFIWLAVAFVLSVLIEGGILLLMKRGAARQNWIASLLSNIVSYVLIILPFVWLTSQ